MWVHQIPFFTVDCNPTEVQSTWGVSLPVPCMVLSCYRQPASLAVKPPTWWYSLASTPTAPCSCSRFNSILPDHLILLGFAPADAGLYQIHPDSSRFNHGFYEQKTSGGSSLISGASGCTRHYSTSWAHGMVQVCPDWLGRVPQVIQTDIQTDSSSPTG